LFKLTNGVCSGNSRKEHLLESARLPNLFTNT